MSNYFVQPGSIVRKIWSSADTILFVFAGSAAEFALNKSVDWLYFTGRLPADPIGRMFSTVAYARQIVFSDEDRAVSAIQKISAIHAGVEERRGSRIPSEAYLDVLFMLIDYSIRAFELLERRLTHDEKEEVFAVFRRQGELMRLEGLPRTYVGWRVMRERHLARNLAYGELSADLFRQYRKHLGAGRYQLLLRVQALLLPESVRSHLPQVPKAGAGLAVLLEAYKASRLIKLDRILKKPLLPAGYKTQFKELDAMGVAMQCPFGKKTKPGGERARRAPAISARPAY